MRRAGTVAVGRKVGPQRRSPGCTPAGAPAQPSGRGLPLIAHVPEIVLNHDPRRERPSDFCRGCVE
jgi:hypothetical protein